MQSSPSPGKYQVSVELLEKGEYPLTANASFDFGLSQQDQERLRWYFEDYLQHTQDPAPAIARQVEGLLRRIGIELFEKIFKSNFDAHAIWFYVRPILNETRVEIVTNVLEGTSIPWELICNPDTLHPLALSADSFMRILAICRPGGDEDVPFRSVASRVISALNKDEDSRFQLKVLRPPTFDQLRRVLRKAKAEGKPYHVLHFDGHGDYLGQRGWISFEYPNPDEDGELVHGNRLGKLMRESDVPVLVLNACRSAYAESPNQPIFEENSRRISALSRIQAFGSLAQEVANCGVAGVVAMRYAVYDVTAAQFFADFYESLVQGQSLEEAASHGRKRLYDQPMRELASGLREIQDWPVPIIYVSGSRVLFPLPEGGKKLAIDIKEAESMPLCGWADPDLPPTPDTGFFGLDETIHAIDRAFDVRKIVLLHGFAGSGKTATAAEFAKWYSLTGGVKGKIIFTSFERYITLPRVLDKIERIFRMELERLGIRWLAIDDVERRKAALQILGQEPIFWIWDNIEPVSGFPTGNKSIWTEAEQNELLDFLRSAMHTQAKFLLTSRRDENNWLGETPRRVAVQPMHILERTELAKAIADKHGHKDVPADDWMPLIEYSQGNPLTITVLMGQALRENLVTKEQITNFVKQLRAGEKEIEDNECLGRSKSLDASLSYGFQQAFNDSERKIISLLHFFQGFVNVDVIMCMMDPLAPWHLDDWGSTREEVIEMLDRAVEVGLLKDLGGVYYSIHPALPWYFKKLFDQYYNGRENEAIRAFVEAVSSFGEYQYKENDRGNSGSISILLAEEFNLLYAIQLALKNKLWYQVISALTGIRILYAHEGRWTEWKRLVQKIEPFYLDPLTGGPIAGRENGWSVISNSKIRLSWQSRQLDEALSLLPNYLKWSYIQAEKYLTNYHSALDDVGNATIWNYIVSLEESGHIQREKLGPQCVENYQKSFEVRKRFGYKDNRGVLSQNLATAYLQVPEIQDLSLAEYWGRESITQTNESDFIARGKSYLLLGQIDLQRIRQIGLRGEEPDQKLLDNAQEWLDKALAAFPEDSTLDMATAHESLGNLYGMRQDYAEALDHYREANRYIDIIGDPCNSAQYRLNPAFIFYDAGILPEAKEFAQYALEKFRECGKFAVEDVKRTQSLLEQIERDLVSA